MLAQFTIAQTVKIFKNGDPIIGIVIRTGKNLHGLSFVAVRTNNTIIQIWENQVIKIYFDLSGIPFAVKIV